MLKNYMQGKNNFRYLQYQLSTTYPHSRFNNSLTKPGIRPNDMTNRQNRKVEQ